MKLLLIDGNHMLHRNLHIEAFQGMSYAGIQTGGAFGFLKSLSSTMVRYCPTKAIVVWDAGRSPRRQAMYPEYKPRPKLGDEKYDEYKEYRGLFDDSQSMLGVILRSLGIQELKIPNHEADDVIGWITRKWFPTGPNGGPSLENGTPLEVTNEMVVVSDDMDLAQLVSQWNPTVVQWRAVQQQEINWENFAEICKVKHRYYVMYKATKGDPADNIPGVKGVGLKTFQQALELLERSAAHIAYTAGLGASEYDAIPLESPLLESWRKLLAEAKSSRLRKLATGFDQFLHNMELIDIEKEIDDFTSDQVETINETLRIPHKMHEQRVMTQLGRLGFKSILNEWVKFISPFHGLS